MRQLGNPVKEVEMKKLALGLVAAGALLTAGALPAMAQVGVYAGPGGIGIQLGAPGYYGAPYFPYGGYYDYAPGGGRRGHPGWHGNHAVHGNYHH
jgi:hypothetical protein